MRFRIRREWFAHFRIRREWFARLSTALAKLCLVVAALAALGVFWRPGFTLGGLGSTILFVTSVIAGFIGIVIAGRVNIYAMGLGENLLKGKKTTPQRQTGPMDSRDTWVQFIDPVWAGGVGYPVANLITSVLGLSFGFVPAMQAVLSNVTGLRKCRLLYDGGTNKQEARWWHRYASWVSVLFLLLSGAGVVMALLGIPVLGIDRGALLFYALVPLNTTLQSLYGPWRWMRQRGRSLNGSFWRRFLVGMLPILGGILLSAVAGIMVAELIGRAFRSAYPASRYDDLLMYHYVQNFLSVLGQETTQVIIGGIGVQLLVNGKHSVFWRVWAVLLSHAATLFRDWVVGLVTLRWLRGRINALRNPRRQP